MSFRYRHGDRPLEGYTILRGLGRGGFGEVYFAVSDGGREVALKAIQQNTDIELRGVKHCINLKSPRLISIFDVKTGQDGVPFVIMEFVAGPSLRDLLRQSPDGLGSVEAAYLLREIARGLAYLHERGIVHRDLKPENLFWEDGFVKIGDYGLSKFISVSRQSGQTISVGTVHYMAPEIGSGNYHQGIDIYALGVILYELLTGKVPYNGNSMGEIIMKHLTAQPDLSGVPEAFRAVIQKALAKKTEERYSRVEDMVEDLFVATGLEKEVDAFDAKSFVSAAPAGSPLENAPTEAASPENKPEDARPRPQKNKKPGNARSQERPSPRGPLPFAGDDLDQRLLLGLGTAAVMALATSFFGVGGFHLLTFASVFAAIVFASGAVLIIEHWAVPRLRIDMGILKTVWTVAVAGVALAMTLAFLPHFAGRWQSLPSLFVGLLLLRWGERARPDRKEMASLRQAIFAGVLGVVASAVLRGSPLLVGGILAAMSLVVNVVSPRFGKAKKPSKPEPGANAPTPDVQREGAVEPPFPGAPVEAPEPGATAPETTLPRNTLVRPIQGRIAAGVCAGLAARYGWEIVLVRLLFLASVVLTNGATLLAYLVLCCMMPSAREPYTLEMAIANRERRGIPTQQKPLIRPRGDRIFAGVCSGIATRYDWEVVWIRFLGVASVFFGGIGIIAYIVLWFLMPTEAKPATASERPERARTLRRALWYTLSLILFGSGLFGLTLLGISEWSEPSIWTPGTDVHREQLAEHFPLFCAMVGLISLSFFAYFRASLRQRLGFWQRNVSPLFLVFNLTALISIVAYLFVTETTAAFQLIALGVVFVCGGFASHQSGQIVGWMRHGRSVEDRYFLENLPARSGAYSLGRLLVIAAITAALGGTFLTSEYGIDFAHRHGILVSSEVARAIAERQHLLLSLLLFLPGLFCLLSARRSGGPAHVARGAFAWLIIASVIGFLAEIPRTYGSWSAIQFTSYLDRSLPHAILIGMFIAGSAGVVILAWPGKAPAAPANEPSVDNGKQMEHSIR